MKVSYEPMDRDALMDESAALMAEMEKAVSAIEWKLETDLTYSHESFDADLKSIRADFDAQESAAFRAHAEFMKAA